jgi:hypothetical protein
MNNPLRADIVRPFIDQHKIGIVFTVYLLLLSPFLIYFLWPIASDMLVVVTEPMRRVAFDSAKWKDESLLRPTPDLRIRMIDDLLKVHNFRGQSQAELKELLGNPDKSQVLKEWDMIYWVGRKKGVIVTTGEWLGFRLNEQQQVVSYELIEKVD